MLNKQVIVGLLGLVAFTYTVTILAMGNRSGAATFTLGSAYYRFDSAHHVNNNAMPNGALAYNFDEHWALEGLVGVVNTTNHNDQGARGVLYLADGLYRFNPHGYFQPYLIAGVGVLGLRPPVGSEPQYQSNINFGVGTQFFADRSVALRGEVKDLYTFSGGKQDIMANFGVSFLMGGS